MRLSNGETVNVETARHKYGGDPMAEYLWTVALNGGFDTGDEVSDGMGSGYHRFGKRVLGWDDQGFVWCDKFPNVADAEEFMVEQYDRLHEECPHHLTDDDDTCLLD